MDDIVRFVVLVAGCAAIAIGFVGWHRRRQDRMAAPAPEPGDIVVSEHHDLASFTFPWPFGSASFDELIAQPTQFAQAVEKRLLAVLNQLFSSMGLGDALNPVVQGFARMLMQNTYIIRFSERGQELLKTGEWRLASNGLPTLINQSGKFTEHGRIVSDWSDWIVKVSPIWSLVVSAAHFISAADLANRIKELDRKVDWLIAMRQVDQWATLERIFYMARELTLAPVDDFRQHELRRLRGELLQLRIVLRREWRQKIDLYAQRQVWQHTTPVVNRIPQVQQWGKSEKRQQFTQMLNESIPYVLMIEFALRLEGVLAMASRTEHEFFWSLSDELKQLEQVLQQINQQETLLQSAHQLPNLFADVVQSYRQVARQPIFAEQPASPPSPRYLSGDRVTRIDA